MQACRGAGGTAGGRRLTPRNRWRQRFREGRRAAITDAMSGRRPRGRAHDDDGHDTGDLLDEDAGFPLDGPHPLLGSVAHDTRYGAWWSAGFPWCDGRVQKNEECRRESTESWARPWPTGRGTPHVTRQHFPSTAASTVLVHRPRVIGASCTTAVNEVANIGPE